MKTVFVAVVVVAGVLFVVFTRPGPSEADAATGKKQLLVYCGITMIQPMTEIARVIEQQEGCEIIITKGGSGNLLRAIKVNKVGDLYLPGSDSYIKTCKEEGLVSETVHVGYNKAALMVRKGNPKGISSDLANLVSPDYYVVIGDPDSGSIGRETKKILERRGIFEQVIANALKLTTDSKDLVNVLRDEQADIVINWYATSIWPENRPYVDALSIDEQYASKKKLVLGLLKFSEHPDIARKFLAYASSAKGRALFQEYGLFDIE
ncbi:MAG: substrate-binding domain-containing protein [Phycisphaerae bacterium]